MGRWRDLFKPGKGSESRPKRQLERPQSEDNCASTLSEQVKAKGSSDSHSFPPPSQSIAFRPAAFAQSNYSLDERPLAQEYHSPSRTSDPVSKEATPCATGPDIWSRAYKALQEREPLLVEAYERELCSDGEGFGTEERIKQAVKTKLENRDARQFIIELAGKSIKIREYGESIAKFVIWSKGIISTAVSAQPYAALAWAGVSIILPVLLTPSEQSEKMLEGLNHTASLIRLYEIRMALYQKLDSQSVFEDAVVQLYSRILEYQARILCHLSHNTIKRGLSNIIRPGQWESFLDAIKKADQECQQYVSFVDKTAEKDQWEKQTLQIERSIEVQQQILDTLSDIKRVRAAERDDDLRKEFLQTFSTDYEGDKNINAKRVPGTCQWFLDDDRFQAWRNSPTSALLWVSAGPGCGKSVLSRSLIDEKLLTNNVKASSVCYFFFKDGLKGRNCSENALSALLHQLYKDNLDSDLVTHALGRFRVDGKALLGMTSKLWDILVETAKDSASGEIVCVLDALDECLEPSREKLLDILVDFYSNQQFMQDSSIRLKLLVTSRPYDNITDKFSSLTGASSILGFTGDDKSKKISQEINLVIDHRVPEVVPMLEPQEQGIIAEHLKARGEHRTYLWLHLILDFIKSKFRSGCNTLKKLQAVINEIPSSVSKAYSAILEKTADPEQARLIFQIILVAKRALTVSEMKVALELANNRDAESLEDLDLPKDTIFAASLRDICGLFVSIHDDRVYLIHQTAREFLIHRSKENKSASGTPRPVPSWQHSVDLSDAELLLAKLCVAFLKFRDFQDLPWLEDNTLSFSRWRRNNYDALVKDRVFLEYSATFWASHYQAVQASLDSYLITSAVELCQTDMKIYRIWNMIYCRSRSWDMSYDETPLTVASTLGLHEVVLRLIRTEPQICTEVDGKDSDSDSNTRFLDVNRRGGHYGSALVAASAEGYAGIVESLIANGADVNAQGGHYGNALQEASSRGHEAVVKILLGARADVNAQGGFYGNALQAASYCGHEAVVKILLDAGADVNTQGGYYGNALQAALYHGNEVVVKMLVDAGADINAQGGYYGNALQAASDYGHETVVKILLDAGADVNTQGGYYGNALQAASYYGHEGVVKMLVDAGADVNTQGGQYGNALQAASYCGHEAVVKILLHAGADVNAQGGYYGNVLQAASHNGHEAVVKILVDTGADINAQGGQYGNALQAASYGGHEAVVKILLDAGADANTQGGQYGNALQAVSCNGNEAVVKMLVDAGADINAQGGYYGNALQAASYCGHEAVVKMLVDAGADVNAQGGRYGNALQAAAQNGDLEVVRFLCAHGADADIHSTTNDGCTPLYCASRKGHLEVVKFLYDHGADADIHTATNNGWRPLHGASYHGHLEVVRFLCAHGADTDIHSTTNDGQTPFKAASENGYLEVAKFLCDHSADANIQTAMNDGDVLRRGMVWDQSQSDSEKELFLERELNRLYGHI